VRFRVLLDGQPPGDDRGTDTGGRGQCTVTEPRFYQLVRQYRSVTERTFQITFTDSGGQACVFTFGWTRPYPRLSWPARPASALR
jgi:hypothetical protein